jgi:hypothetical protein
VTEEAETKSTVQRRSGEVVMSILPDPKKHASLAVCESDYSKPVLRSRVALSSRDKAKREKEIQNAKVVIYPL